MCGSSDVGPRRSSVTVGKPKIETLVPIMDDRLREEAELGAALSGTPVPVANEHARLAGH